MASRKLIQKKFDHIVTLHEGPQVDEVEVDMETQFGRTMSYVKHLMMDLGHRIHDGHVIPKSQRR